MIDRHPHETRLSATTGPRRTDQSVIYSARRPGGVKLPPAIFLPPAPPASGLASARNFALQSFSLFADTYPETMRGSGAARAPLFLPSCGCHSMLMLRLIILLLGFCLGALRAAEDVADSAPEFLPPATVSAGQNKPATESGAEVLDAPVPVKKTPAPPAPKPRSAAAKTPAPHEAPPAEGPAEGVMAELVTLPPLPPLPVRKDAPKERAKAGSAKTVAVSDAAPKTERAPKAEAVSSEPGYPTVLSGTLGADLELGPEQSPVLVRGNVVIPAGIKLKFKAGASVTLAGDPKGEKPSQPGAPDPQVCGVIWVWGALLVEGVTGNPVELATQGKEESSLLLYGSAASKIEGARLKGVNVAQSGGVCFWTNCELVNLRHFALAGGASLATHCTFRNCGGLFATYNTAPWSLLLRKNVFDGCREGVILGNDPGEARLVIEKNHFLNTRGAHLRAMPVAVAKDSKAKKSDEDWLIGENWYGTSMAEEVDMRIIDRRIDASIRARLNIRPPAESPYSKIGAGQPASAQAATLQEQSAIRQKLLQAHAAALSVKTPAPEKAPEKTAMKPVGKN
jgi:hypothetical protein